jgi:hypothetical protein
MLRNVITVAVSRRLPPGLAAAGWRLAPAAAPPPALPLIAWSAGYQ